MIYYGLPVRLSRCRSHYSGGPGPFIAAPVSLSRTRDRIAEHPSEKRMIATDWKTSPSHCQVRLRLFSILLLPARGAMERSPELHGLFLGYPTICSCNPPINILMYTIEGMHPSGHGEQVPVRQHVAWRVAAQPPKEVYQPRLQGERPVVGRALVSEVATCAEAPLTSPHPVCSGLSLGKSRWQDHPNSGLCPSRPYGNQ